MPLLNFIAMSSSVRHVARVGRPTALLCDERIAAVETVYRNVDAGGDATRIAAGIECMTYRAPVADIAFTLKHGAGLAPTLAGDGELTADDVDAVLAEAGRFATDVLAPLNAVGDRHGTPFKDGAVTMPPGWKEAYRGLGRSRLERGVGCRPNGAARRCRTRSTPPASRCGIRPRWHSASGRC